MSDTQDKEAATKARIIAHMNADHQKEMSNYLRHYASLPASQTQSPELLDISYTHLTLTTAHASTCTPPTAYRIPITPPLTSYSDMRRVAIEMNSIAQKALGESSIVVSRWIPPYGMNQWLSAIFCALCIGSVGLCGEVWAAERFGLGKGVGWVVYHEVLERILGLNGMGWYLGFVKWVAVPIVVIHAVECGLMVGRLRRYNVKDNKVWWAWMASNFVEGFWAVKRFGKEVERLEGEGKKGL